MITVPHYTSSSSISEMFRIGSGSDMTISHSNGPSRQSSNASSCSVSGLSDHGQSTSHFFEVFYIGKIKVSHKKAPPSFTDDALERFRVHDAQKMRIKSPGGASPTWNHEQSDLKAYSSAGSSASASARNSVSPERDSKDLLRLATQKLANEISVLKDKNSSSPKVFPDSNASQSLDPLSALAKEAEKKRMNSGDVDYLRPLVPEFESRLRLGSLTRDPHFRPRLASATSIDGKSNHEQNRTMLFEIGRYEIRLISPDRKSKLLTKPIKDLTFVSQGIKYADHFGFICREANCDTYVGYLFKCQSPSISEEILTSLKQAVIANSDLCSFGSPKSRSPSGTCEHCPCVWYQKLIAELEGLSLHRVRSVLLTRVQNLPERDRLEIQTKVDGAEVQSVREETDLYLLLLKAQCEAKQLNHVHDSAESRNEFLSHVLERGSGAILKKARNSIATSFDHLLKKKADPLGRELSLPEGASLQRSDLVAPPTTPKSTSNFAYDDMSSPDIRPRSSTVSASGGERIQKELRDMRLRKSSRNMLAEYAEPDTPPPASRQDSSTTPIMNIFLKVGSPSSEPNHENGKGEDLPKTPRHRSWRQAIFTKVMSSGGEKAGVRKSRRTRDELRTLWKWAIRQQIMLIRMNKENKKLKAKQEEAIVRRQKLEYTELPSCGRESVVKWDCLVVKDVQQVTVEELVHAVKLGVPKQKRIDVWNFLVRFHTAHHDLPHPLLLDHYSPTPVSPLPQMTAPYEDLICQLTSCQHSILIDLGRTFPDYAYYSSFMGPGQLSLYNVLKAYSLFDPEVGYCQGLSFVVGIILLHASEEESFSLLKYLLVTKNLRSQFLSNMAAIQVQLYQLTRLLHDRSKDLYEHLESNDVAPTLYATPWFLTCFASQFPIGFVTRVFDLLFLIGPSASFRVAIALLEEHKDMLLASRNLDQLMDYFKSALPAIGQSETDRVISKALHLNIGRQLAAYEVEYYVLQEEMTANSFRSAPSTEQADTLAIKRLERQLKEVQTQLDISRLSNKEMNIRVAELMGKNRRLEDQVYQLQSQVGIVTDQLTVLMPKLSDNPVLSQEVSTLLQILVKPT